MLGPLVVRTGSSVERYVYFGRGRAESIHHRPWLVIEEGSRTRRFLEAADTGESYDFLAFNDSSMRYEKCCTGRVVYLREPSEVARLTAALDERGIRHSMSNIRYEARFSMDLTIERGFMGFRAPLPLHHQPDELETVLEDIYRKAEGLKIIGFDIEVAGSKGFPEPGDKVFIVSLSDGEEAWTLEGDEVFELPRELSREQPDWVVGFNSYGFDVPYLDAFYQRFGVDGVFPSRSIVKAYGRMYPIIDVMRVLDAHGSAFGLPFGSRLALDEAAARLGLASEEELEIEESVDRSRIYDIYKASPETVLRYARVDALLTARLGRLVIRVLSLLHALTGIAPNVVEYLPSLGSLAEYSTFDIVRLRHGEVYEVRWRKYEASGLDDKKLPIIYRREAKEYTPSFGIFEDVAEYDFNMLYPSIYVHYRLDPAGVEEAPEGFRFPLKSGGSVRWVRVTSKGGHVSEVLSYFYYARKATKSLKKKGIEAPDMAVKILANSAYGAFSKGRGMGINEAVAGFIFFKANEILYDLIRFIHWKLGLRVIYAATDAVFVELRGRDPSEVEEQLNSYVQERWGPEFSLKLEDVFKRFALVKRKTYFAVGRSGVVIKGIEKLPLPVAVRENIDEVFRAALEEGRGTEKLRDVIRRASDRDLFIRKVKRLGDLADGKRWKTMNNIALRAAAVAWSLRLGRATITWSDLEKYREIPVEARFLRTSPSSFLLLEGSRVLEVKWLGASVAPEGLKIAYRARIVSPGRRELEKLAYENTGPLLEYLSFIEKQARLGVFVSQWARLRRP